MTLAKVSPSLWPSPPRFLRGEMAMGIPAPPGSGTSIFIWASPKEGAPSSTTNPRSTHHLICLSPRPCLLMILVRAFLSAKGDLDFLRGKFLLISLRSWRQGIGFIDRPHDRFIKGAIPRPFHQFDREYLTIRLHAKTNGSGQPRFFLGYNPALFYPPFHLFSVHNKFESPHNSAATLTWSPSESSRARVAAGRTGTVGLIPRATFLFLLHFSLDLLDRVTDLFFTFFGCQGRSLGFCELRLFLFQLCCGLPRLRFGLRFFSFGFFLFHLSLFRFRFMRKFLHRFIFVRELHRLFLFRLRRRHNLGCCLFDSRRFLRLCRRLSTGCGRLLSTSRFFRRLSSARREIGS